MYSSESICKLDGGTYPETRDQIIAVDGCIIAGVALGRNDFLHHRFKGSFDSKALNYVAKEWLVRRETNQLVVEESCPFRHVELTLLKAKKQGITAKVLPACLHLTTFPS